jgi:hypothetical protein
VEVSATPIVPVQRAPFASTRPGRNPIYTVDPGLATPGYPDDAPDIA